MTRARFEHALKGASDASKQFAMRLVTNHLPDARAYILELNNSFDENPLAEDEIVYPEDQTTIGDISTPLSFEEVIAVLWRDGAIPEWIDIAPIRASGSQTIFQLICCGRFTANPERLYYRDSEWSPFGVKSPTLPPRWTQNDEPFDLNLTRNHVHS